MEMNNEPYERVWLAWLQVDLLLCVTMYGIKRSSLFDMHQGNVGVTTIRATDGIILIFVMCFVGVGKTHGSDDSPLDMEKVDVLLQCKIKIKKETQ